MRIFAGVCFALLGFDPLSGEQYRSEIVRHGGADAGAAQEGRTHLVVSGLVYDDPVCVAARKDGTKVVTALWVDDCLVLGAMADTDHILYRPVRDLEGIPGAESLCICLTGYQRQNGSESIMRMVNMMGARFSKPLSAKRVTHLICYKFEGKNHELAKMEKINIINHQWLEDCLKAWDILPVDNYTARSGWELEMMAAEAIDSEDEAQSPDRGSSDSRGIARNIPATEIATKIPANPGGHMPIHGPSVSSTDAEVPAGTHKGNSQHIREVKDASEWSVDVTGDVDAVVPAGRPLKSSHMIREVEDVSKRSLDVRANRLSTPNANVVTISADPHAHPQVDKVEVVAVPKEIPLAAVPGEYASGRTLGVRADRLQTPKANVVTISSVPHAHALEGYKVEVLTADSEHATLFSRTSFEEGPKEILITALLGEYAVLPHKVSTSYVRNPGAKRSRTPEDETAAESVHSNCHFAAPKCKHPKVISSGSVQADPEKNCSLNAAESTTVFPEEIWSRARNATSKSPLNAKSEMNAATVITEENHTTSARPTAGKTKRVSFESSFLEAVNAEGSTSKVSSSASADSPETCSPSRVLKYRLHKAIVKRSGREACRTFNILSESSKLPQDNYINSGKATVYKGLDNSDEAGEDIFEGLQSSKHRISKRQKVAHNKENIPARPPRKPDLVCFGSHPIENGTHDREPVQIFVNNGRPTLTLNVKLDEPSRYMMETYKRSSNINYSDFYFSYKRKIISPDHTLSSYDICEGCTIKVNTRVRGGRLSFEEYVETHKHNFTEIAKLPDGNLSLKVLLRGCHFLSSLLSCIMITWSRKKSWNGQIVWNTHFKVADDGIVQISTKAINELQSSSMDKDVHSLVQLLDYAFSNGDVRLKNRRPPYFDHLVHYLMGIKSSALNPVQKLTIASHPSYMLSHERLMLTVSLRRKYKGLSKIERAKWDAAMDTVAILWANDLLQLPVFKDRKAEADKMGQPYDEKLRVRESFRLSRDYSMHCLEGRWVDDPNAASHEKDKQIEKFKHDDGVELMLPLHMKQFLANLLEQLIKGDIDINRELSSAIVRCTKCTIEPSHPVVAEPISGDYLPSWITDLSKAQQSELRRKVSARNIGTIAPKPKNWSSALTGECSNSQPNPWNANKTLGMFSAPARPSGSMLPESSTAGRVQAQPSSPVAVASTQTAQAQGTVSRTRAEKQRQKGR